MVDYLERRTINGVHYTEELRWLHQETVKKKGKMTSGGLL